MTETYGDLPVLGFTTQDEFDAWLAERHDTAPGLWVKIAKKGAGQPGLSHTEAVEVALCHGWIDSQAASLDEAYFLQRFTRRSSRSPWSLVNVRRAEELTAEGRMRAGGLREIEAAKADGRWAAAYQPPSEATVPDDLRAAVDADPKAAETFEQLSRSNRYLILLRIGQAKRPETRARRIERYVTQLAAGQKTFR